MKLCERCGEEHNGSFGSGRFCSRSCANSRTFSKESKLLKSIKSSAAWKDGRMDGIDFKVVNNDPEKIQKSKDTWIEKYLQEREEGTIHCWDTIRKYHFIIKNYTCEVCGTNEWNGQEVPLELHHIDGDITNNGDDNLQVICPNCHSQTDNFRGRNVNYYSPKDQDQDEFIDNRIADFTLTDLMKEYMEMESYPNGFLRKRHYFITKYKISDGMMAKVISIYHKDPTYLEMIDKDEDLTVGMVYKMLT